LGQVVETPAPQYFEQALNCVRVLTRVMPFLLEEAGDPFVEELCWVRQPEDQDADQADASEAKAQAAAGEAMEEQFDPLATLLVHASMHLLFLPQFTIDLSALDEELMDGAGEYRNHNHEEH
jgi:hypothetical protein